MNKRLKKLLDEKPKLTKIINNTIYGNWFSYETAKNQAMCIIDNPKDWELFIIHLAKEKGF